MGDEVVVGVVVVAGDGVFGDFVGAGVVVVVAAGFSVAAMTALATVGAEVVVVVDSADGFRFIEAGTMLSACSRPFLMPPSAAAAASAAASAATDCVLLLDPEVVDDDDDVVVLPDTIIFS